MFDKGAQQPTKCQMLILFYKLSVPAILSSVLMYSEVVVTTIFAARMNDKTKLAAVGLSAVYLDIMIISLMMGINMGLETLASQAFGHGNIRLCGLYLNRGCFILITFFLLFAITPAMFAE